MKDMENIKIAREETDLEWRPVLDGVHAYADLRRLGRKLAVERFKTDDTIAYLTGQLERAISNLEKLTRKRNKMRAEVEKLRTRTAAQLEIETRARDEARAEAERLRYRLQTVVDEQVSPHETLPAEELITLLEHSLAEGRHERERLRGALERAERALQGIATAQRFDRDVFSDDSAYVDWARSLSLHVAEIARAALAGEGEAKRCTWTYDETHCAWDSSCGEKWIIMDGGPNENEIRFCHGCGKPVEIACEATPEKARQGEGR